MRIDELYDNSKKCKTPGAVYKTDISDKKVKSEVVLPMKLELTKKEALDLESDLHYAIEKVLSKFFK